MQIMYKVNLKSLPVSTHRIFSCAETKYDSRDVCKFTVPMVKKETMWRCLTVVGVTLWNNTNINRRTCGTFLVFKRMVSEAIFKGYKSK